jgi:N-acetylglucosaminyldiphosphoundecaprenol N-acetyl-beta-D-mannosaminyltransferase
VCGVVVHALDADRTVERVIDLALDGGGAVHLVNAHVLSLAARSESFTGLLNDGDLNVPDGVPVAWIGRRLGLDVEKVPGADLFSGVVNRGRGVGLRHYLYGSTPIVIERLSHQLSRLFEGAEVVGAESPPFRPLTRREEEDLVRRIRGADPDVVWVGLGTPKQDEFVGRFRDQLGAVLIPVGAAFEFLAGTRTRAPAWMQQLGLEWFHRLLSEPRRLWRRYLVGNLVFLWTVFRERPQVVRHEPER